MGDYITYDTAESTQVTQVTPNLSQSTMSKNIHGSTHMLNKNHLVGMVSGLNSGLNHISSLQTFEQCNYQSSQSKGNVSDPRYPGPQGAGMLKYSQALRNKQALPSRIGQCRSHDKIVGSGVSQSQINGSTTSLRDFGFA